MGNKVGRFSAQVLAAVALSAVTLGADGCGNFFVCQKASCPSSGTGTTNTVNLAVVSNSATSSTAVGVFNISTGSPVAVGGSPFSLGYATNAMVITPNNDLLYAAGPQAVYAYTISSAGALSNANGTSPVLNQGALAMDVSPDGKYLFVLTGNVQAYVLSEYPIGTNGVLAAGSNVVLPLTGASAAAMKVSPTGDFVAIAMGLAGDVIVPLSSDIFSSTVSSSVIPAPSNQIGDYAVTVDSNNNIYFARTNSVAIYTATTSGVPTLVPNSNATTGAEDYSIVTDGTSVYTGNASPSTISVFGLNSAEVLSTPVTVPGPGSVAAIGIDSSGKYLVAAGYGSSGLQEFTIGASGGLTASTTSVATGTSTAATLVMALTH